MSSPANLHHSAGPSLAPKARARSRQRRVWPLVCSLSLIGACLRVPGAEGDDDEGEGGRGYQSTYQSPPSQSPPSQSATPSTPAGQGNAGLSGAAAAVQLSAGIRLPNEGTPLNNPAIDDSVTLMASFTGQAAAQPIAAGGVNSVSLPFESTNGNVVAAGIRFGETGPVRTVSIPGASGATAGTLDFQFQVPADICNQLSNICHDIKCYEYAVTSAGRVSRANVQSIAVLCANCNEPSCSSLVSSTACNNARNGGTTPPPAPSNPPPGNTPPAAPGNTPPPGAGGNPNPAGSCAVPVDQCAALGRASTLRTGCCTLPQAGLSSCADGCGNAWYECGGRVFGPCPPGDTACVMRAAEAVLPCVG
jgi:hypothetical protein